MENNNQQYLNTETYTAIIQDLGTTIGNLNIELSLARMQYKEMLEHAQNLQQELILLKEECNKEEEEVVSE